MTREVSIVIKGKPSYERWSIYQWLLENIDLLEKEYCIKINIVVTDSFDETPVLVIDNIIVDDIPFDEGYLIEIIKKTLDKLTEHSCVE